MMQLTIIGFGNQAKSWASNLRDSQFPVRIALRKESPNLAAVQKEKFNFVEIGSQDFYQSEILALLIPDDAQESFIKEHAQKFSKGTIILYAHGYAVSRFKLQEKYPDLTHVLFAPKSIGSELRKQFLAGGQLGAVYSLEFTQENSEEIDSWLKALAKAMGINMGPFKTSFLRETNADLYSEQGLLCSLIPYAASEMFNHLVSEGTEPELAYFECWHELKLIINAMVDKGPEGFFDLISPNALIGAEKGYQRLMDKNFQQKMHSLFDEIKSGEFDQEVKNTNINELRKRISERWEKDELNKTFIRMNP